MLEPVLMKELESLDPKSNKEKRYEVIVAYAESILKTRDFVDQATIAKELKLSQPAFSTLEKVLKAQIMQKYCTKLVYIQFIDCVELHVTIDLTTLDLSRVQAIHSWYLPPNKAQEMLEIGKEFIVTYGHLNDIFIEQLNHLDKTLYKGA